MILMNWLFKELDFMKRRQLVYVPEINPTSFVLLFEKGRTGLSWSIRHYADLTSVSVRYAREFSLTISEIRAKAMRSGRIFEAPTVATTYIDYWYKLISGYNKRYLESTLPEPLRASEEPADHGVPSAPQENYPVLEGEKLSQHSKWLKRQDRDWILRNGRSEDWVTWNAFTLLTRGSDVAWWPHLLSLALKSNPDLLIPVDWHEQPEIRFWQPIGSPRAYEVASRTRMRCSGNRERILRSHNLAPVEGPSEIDVVLQNARVLVYVEAKLQSDVSLRTTNDPSRNQIARNIDCVLDQTNGHTPLFLMLVRDAGEGRAYTQLISKYRRDPATLVEELPHHDPEVVKSVARNLAIVLWRDLLSPSVEITADDDDITSAVKEELRRRVLSELE
jgi:hypothetical protein